MAELILGIDGGGTTTKCVACNLKGEIVGQATAGPSNHQTIPWERVAKSLTEAIDESLGEYSKEDVVSICGGMAGRLAGSETPVLELFRVVSPGGSCCCARVAIALHAVIEKLPGVIVISGTGAMGMARMQKVTSIGPVVGGIFWETR